MHQIYCILTYIHTCINTNIAFYFPCMLLLFPYTYMFYRYLNEKLKHFQGMGVTHTNIKRIHVKYFI